MVRFVLDDDKVYKVVAESEDAIWVVDYDNPCAPKIVKQDGMKNLKEIPVPDDYIQESVVSRAIYDTAKKMYADDLYVEIGETKSINVYTDVEGLEAGEGGTKYTFENGSNAICAVNVNGEVTGITVGESTVKIQNEYGLETEATVHVTAKTSHITFGYPNQN